MKPLSPEKFPNCNVEAQYQAYLGAVKLHEENMGKEQRRETRRAFYGAFGALLMLQRDEISGYSEMDGVLILERLLTQVDEFFKKEVDESGLPLQLSMPDVRQGVRRWNSRAGES